MTISNCRGPGVDLAGTNRYCGVALAGRQSPLGQNEAAWKAGSHLTAAEHIGMRLRPTCGALGFNQREFATPANLQPDRFSQYKTGTRPLAIEASSSSLINTVSASIGFIAVIDRGCRFISQSISRASKPLNSKHSPSITFRDFLLTECYLL
jgi:hypothetical protein